MSGLAFISKFDRRHGEAVVDTESVLDRAGRGRGTFPEAVAYLKILRDAERRIKDDPGRLILRKRQAGPARCGAAKARDELASSDHK